MPTVTVDNQTLYYTHTRGPAGAPALFLIHPAGGTHLDWPPQLRRLPQAAVYAVDLPGHGRSAPPGRQRIEDYAAAVQTLIGRLDLDDAVLAGHSMGGAIALEIALQQPAWLRGLVLMGSGAQLPVNPQFLAQTREDFAGAVEFMARYSWSPEAPADLVAAGRAQLAQTSPDVLSGDLLACNRYDRRDDVHGITVPTLVITGGADRMTPPALGEYLARTIPQAELLQLEGAGHMLMLERADAVAVATGNFISRLAGEES
ncbi:MAG: alpha/beta hydrolase [Anaerolineae bacterium]|nr:alpha/beta hydrolase [Anaerolineae bacterium]